MKSLSQQERDRIQSMLSNEETYELGMIGDFIGHRERERIEQSVADAMKAEGHGVSLKPGVANLYGAEFGRMLHEKLLDLSIGLANQVIWKNEDRLRKVICVDFQYCKRRNQPSFADASTLAAAIGDSILASWTQVPLPVPSISVYLVKYNVLERLCECPKDDK